jgi:hypothetical protein
MTWLGLHQVPFFELEKPREFRPKCLVFIICSTSGIHSLLASPAWMRYDAEFFYASVMTDIEKNLCDGKRRKTLRGVHLYLANAPTHNAKRSRQEISRTKATRVVHPAYSHDAAPSDFLSFGCLKAEMAGFTANSAAGILSEIGRVFQEMSEETLMALYGEWITRLKWITDHKGECYHAEENKCSTL